MTGLGLSADPYITENGTYSVDAAADATSYTLTATPQGGQAQDTDCANLTLTSNSVKGASGTDTADCW